MSELKRDKDNEIKQLKTMLYQAKIITAKRVSRILWDEEYPYSVIDKEFGFVGSKKFEGYGIKEASLRITEWIIDQLQKVEQMNVLESEKSSKRRNHLQTYTCLEGNEEKDLE